MMFELPFITQFLGDTVLIVYVCTYILISKFKWLDSRVEDSVKCNIGMVMVKSKGRVSSLYEYFAILTLLLRCMLKYPPVF